MEDGFISVKPLKLGVGNGSVVADIALDGRKSPIHTIADLDFRELDFSKVVDKLTIFRGTGTIGGKATLDMHGNSVRSEEHTSELQSIMRISSAIFCLKKK